MATEAAATLAPQTSEPGHAPGSEEARILIVDDDHDVRRSLTRVLTGAGYACRAAATARTASRMLDRERFDLVLCNLHLPGESGLELVEHTLREHGQVAAVVITGREEPALACGLFRRGALGYLVEPFTPGELLIGIAGAFERQKRERAQRIGRERLKRELARCRHQVAALERALRAGGEGEVVESIACLARAIQLRSGEDVAHGARVGAYCGLIARRLGLGEQRASRIAIASQLHDVGKLAVPDALLLKAGPLTPDERLVVEQHAELGHRILAPARNALLRLAAVIALTHHERYDGSGYPRGLSSEAIPLEGRIVAAADVFDALSSERPYRRALSVAEATAMVSKDAGRGLDPRVVDAFFVSLDDVRALRRAV